MSFVFERAILLVTAVDADGGPENPGLPEDWIREDLGDNWYVLTQVSDGSQVVAYKSSENAGGTRGLYGFLGPIATVSLFETPADIAVSMREAGRTQLSLQPLIRNWTSWYCSGAERIEDLGLVAFSGARKIMNFGGQLPPLGQPKPWLIDHTGSLVAEADASYRIDTLDRPWLHVTLASLGMNQLADDEPDPGA